MKKIIIGLIACGFVSLSSAATVVNIRSLDNQKTTHGSVMFIDTEYGLLIQPNLENLTPGLHGFHVHVNPSCGMRGMAAGGHLDPQKTGAHHGPYSNKGHLGDLPALYVDEKGIADQSLLAPRLKEADLKNHAIMIHEGGDNYSDQPEKLGGGGKRVACGVIEKE